MIDGSCWRCPHVKQFLRIAMKTYSKVILIQCSGERDAHYRKVARRCIAVGDLQLEANPCHPDVVWSGTRWRRRDFDKRHDTMGYQFFLVGFAKRAYPVLERHLACGWAYEQIGLWIDFGGGSGSAKRAPFSVKKPSEYRIQNYMKQWSVSLEVFPIKPTRTSA